MTAEIINLRQFRKRKARAERETAAESNRQKFGLTKAERSRKDAQRALEERRLDNHERDD